MRIFSDHILAHFQSIYKYNPAYVNIDNAPTQIRLNCEEKNYHATIYARNLAIFKADNPNLEIYATTFAKRDDNQTDQRDVVILLACYHSDAKTVESLMDCVFEKAVTIKSLEEYYPTLGKLRRRKSNSFEEKSLLTHCLLLIQISHLKTYEGRIYWEKLRAEMKHIL